MIFYLPSQRNSIMFRYNHGHPKRFFRVERQNACRNTSTALKSGCTARDQGHLNYLYFAKHLGVTTVVQSRGEGIVNTVGYITPRTTIDDHLKGDFVVNSDGKVSAVVHQYDRFPKLNALLSILVSKKSRQEQSNDFITNKRYISICDMSYKTRSKDNFHLPLKPNLVICAKVTLPRSLLFSSWISMRSPWSL